MQNQTPNPEHILSYWIRNLVGRSGVFSTNLMITVFGGSLYSFGVVPSHYMLLIFGVISPLIFTLCLYYSIRQIPESNIEASFPKIFSSRSGNITLMIFDMSIIVGLAILIHTGYINFFFFRFLQTVLLPMLMLFILRFVFLMQGANQGDMDEG